MECVAHKLLVCYSHNSRTHALMSWLSKIVRFAESDLQSDFSRIFFLFFLFFFFSFFSSLLFHLFFFPVMLYYSYTLMFSLFYSIVAMLLCVVLFAQ